MDTSSLLQRILNSVDVHAYQAPVSSVPEAQRPAIEQIRAALTEARDPARARQLAQKYFDEGALDLVQYYSAMHVIAASPLVSDWEEAARLAGAQELAAIRRGGPNLQQALASVDRHRGVVAFLNDAPDVALEHFTSAMERERSPENLGNILCTLLRLGELDEAEQIVATVRDTLPPSFVDALLNRIELDPDLAALRH